MIELVTDNDVLVLFGQITIMAALALIIVEIINFLPDLMLSVLNRMRNKSMSELPDTLNDVQMKDSLDQKNMDTKMDKIKTLSESDLFKRFGRKKDK